jgi:hypothetical protein
MKPELSFPCLQEPSTTSYPEPDQSNPYRPIPCLQGENVLVFLKVYPAKVLLRNHRSAYNCIMRCLYLEVDVFAGKPDISCVYDIQTFIATFTKRG